MWLCKKEDVSHGIYGDLWRGLYRGEKSICSWFKWGTPMIRDIQERVPSKMKHAYITFQKYSSVNGGHSSFMVASSWINWSCRHPLEGYQMFKQYSSFVHLLPFMNSLYWYYWQEHYNPLIYYAAYFFYIHTYGCCQTLPALGYTACEKSPLTRLYL